MVRTGLLLVLVVVAWLWSVRPWGRADGARPLETLGVGSLFVYWVHVELVYGIATKPLRHALTLEQCVIAWAVFSLAMFALLLGWNASRPTRLWIADELLKLVKSETWTARPLADR
jgi:cytosine/uracil/thiamine/allantoin permease